MKYIDADKLIAKIKGLQCEQGFDTGEAERAYQIAIKDILAFIDTLQQEQPKGNLEYWLQHFGMPKENIDNCITQIAQGYGACRYLEGIQHGAEAVNELAKQEQPEVDLDKIINNYFKDWKFDDELDIMVKPNNYSASFTDLKDIARHFYELGLNARKED